MDEPLAHFTQRQPMTHRHGASAHKAFLALAQGQPFDRATGGVGAIKHPHRFAGAMGGFQQIEQSCDKGVDTASKVLKIKQENIRRIHHGRRRATHLPIKAEHRNTEALIQLVLGFDHIILLVALQPMLGAKGAGQPNAVTCGQSIQPMHQPRRDRGGMGNQRHALAFQRLAQGGIGQQAVKSVQHRHGASADAIDRVKQERR
jgi:hypothetical protein